jgi:hypothetical protein
VLFSLITRGVRFFTVAALLNRYGAPINALLEKYFGYFLLLFVAAVALGFFVGTHWM